MMKIFPHVKDDGNGGSSLIIPNLKPKKARVTFTGAMIITTVVTVSGWAYSLIRSQAKSEISQANQTEQLADHEVRIRANEECYVRVETNVEIIKENVDRLLDIALKDK